MHVSLHKVRVRQLLSGSFKKFRHKKDRHAPPNTVTLCIQSEFKKKVAKFSEFHGEPCNL